MTATVRPVASPGTAPPGEAVVPRLEPAAGVELLGDVHGCGYRDGACLVRRGDGQIVQLGKLMFALLECMDGRRGGPELAEALSQRTGRRVGAEHVARLAQKLAQQGLLAGTEQLAPAKRNPLLALRFKMLVTNPAWTRRLTAPFAFLFRPWIMWPVVLAFAGVFWFVLLHKGIASATAQAFHRPALLLLVFALAVASAGIHELGHAAACRYGGATPGGMGMGLYLVWPAFYTDVTDTYRLPKTDRLRVDLAGLYFNALISVLTLIAWLVFRVDALLLLVALQVLQMAKQLSPVIRADGYHILSDLTGVPDLFSHLGPTMRRLLPRHRREPSALSAKARTIVTLWVLIIVPVLLSMMVGAILVLPHIATSAWNSGQHIAGGIPREARHTQIVDLLASVLQLFALLLPVLGSVLIAQKVSRMAVSRARAWSRGSVLRTLVATVVAFLLLGALAWAWWPAGQYRPVRANQQGTLSTLVRAVSAPLATAHPADYVTAAPLLAPGRYLAVSMIPVHGASRRRPAFFILINRRTHRTVAVLGGARGVAGSAVAFPFRGSASGLAGSGQSTGSGASTYGGAGQSSATGGTSTGATGQAGATGNGSSSSGSTTHSGSGTGTTSSRTPTTTTPTSSSVSGGSAHNNSASAVNTTDHGVMYDVAYSLVTVTGGQTVDERNSASAQAQCTGCTTVAVAFQVVLVVGESRVIDPINTATSLNTSCPSCTTTAMADQIVVTLDRKPTKRLLDELNAALRKLGALSELGAGGTPAAVTSYVAAIQNTINSELAASGLLANGSNSLGTGNTAGGGQSSGGGTGGGGSAGGSTGSTSTTGSGGSTGSSGSGTGNSSSGSGATSSSASNSGSSGSSSGSSGSAGQTSTTGSSSSSSGGGGQSTGGESTATGTTTTATGASTDTVTTQTGTSTDSSQDTGTGTDTTPTTVTSGSESDTTPTGTSTISSTG